MNYQWQRACVLFCLCIVLLGTVVGCTREQQKVRQQKGTDGVTVRQEVVSKTTLIATIADTAKTYLADPPDQPYYLIEFNESGSGAFYVASFPDGLHVVHNGKIGRSINQIDTLAISPDGSRIAYCAQVGDRWSMVIDDNKGDDLDEVINPVFSPDSKHIAYFAKKNETWHVVVDDREGPVGLYYHGKPEFSGDSARLVYLETTKDDLINRLTVCDLSFKHRYAKEIVNGQIAINKDKSRIAAIEPSKGKQRMIEFSIDQPDAITEGPLYDAINKLTFGPDGVSVSYAAERDGKRLLVLNDREDPLPDGEMIGLPVVLPANKEVGVLMSSKDGFFLHRAFSSAAAKEKQYRRFDEAADLVYSSDGNLYAYSARKGTAWFAVANGKEGPAFDRVVMPVFSPDNRLLVYRARKNGKRFVVIADATGRVVLRHPVYDQVFQPVFTPDGKSVAYGVLDGRKLVWKVERLPVAGVGK